MKKLLAVVCMFAVVSHAQTGSICIADPVEGVPEFKSISISLSPNILSKLAVACDPVSPYIDKLAQMILDSSQTGLTANMISTAKDGPEKLLKFVNANKSIAGGLAAHLAKCVQETVQADIMTKIPKAFTDAGKMALSAKEAYDLLNGEYNRIQGILRSGKKLTGDDIKSALKPGKEFLAKGAVVISSLKSVISAIATAVRHPERLLMNDEISLAGMASQAADQIRMLSQTCNLPQAQADLAAFVSMGQGFLTPHRLAYAQDSRREYEAADAIARNFIRRGIEPGFNWKDRSHPGTIARARVLVGDIPYDNWVLEYNAQQATLKKSTGVQQVLSLAGPMCASLQLAARAVEAQKTAYINQIAQAEAAIKNCSRLQEADAIIRRLATAEKTVCGRVLTDGLLAPAPPPVSVRPSVPGPTTNVGGGTAANQNVSLIPPSQQLAAKLSLARGTCTQPTSSWEGNWILRTHYGDDKEAGLATLVLRRITERDGREVSERQSLKTLLGQQFESCGPGNARAVFYQGDMRWAKEISDYHQRGSRSSRAVKEHPSSSAVVACDPNTSGRPGELLVGKIDGPAGYAGTLTWERSNLAADRFSYRGDGFWGLRLVATVQPQ